jgi:hypothetical protein
MNRPLPQFVCLLVIPALLGLIFNAVRANSLKIFDDRPMRPPLENGGQEGNGDSGGKAPDEFDIEELKTILEAGEAIIIDARKPEKFLAGHLVTAINIPSTQIFRPETINKVKALISPADEIVIYCGGHDCNSSKDVHEFLIGLEYPAENIRIFKPGWELLGQADIPKAVGEE